MRDMHTITWRDGTSQPCDCPQPGDHDALVIDDEEYVEVTMPGDEDQA